MIKKIIKKPKKRENKTLKKNLFYVFSVVVIKVFLIGILLFGLYENDSSFSNTISLLAVSENSNGEIVAGSVIDLSLTVKPGRGDIFVNQNALVEIDTQISISNSQKTSCLIFDLDCDNYDFYYEFDSSSTVLKGPSASSAIAILTAKTIKNEHIKTKDVTITGSLNSGGVIGVVGGVDKKIETALSHNFEKVLVPAFADFNKTKEYLGIKVIRSVDIVDAYNEFNGDNYELNLEKVESSEYQLLMKKLSDDMCLRNDELNSSIDYSLIDENSSLSNLINRSKEGLQNAKKSDLNGNYYSMGSFCYGANINFRTIVEKQKNLSLESRNKEILEFKERIENTIEVFTSDNYKNNIKTLNDFYVYLVLLDRTYEAKDYIEQAYDLKINFSNYEITDLDEIDVTENESSLENSSNQTIEKLKVNSSFINNLEKIILSQKEDLYSVAVERFYTVSLWEKFIENLGREIKFNDLKVSNVCQKINREISIKQELLDSYELDFFNELINKQLEFDKFNKDKYLCVYSGLELDGRINTVLSSAGITDNNDTEFVEKFIDLTQSRINLNSNGAFPFIPTIYSEYSGDLISQGDVSSGLLYANYAMSYANLNIYLEDDKSIEKEILDTYFDELFDNFLFIFAMLFLIAFLN